MIKETDPIYCIELPHLKEVTQDTGEYILLVWVNTLIVDDQCARYIMYIYMINGTYSHKLLIEL